MSIEGNLNNVESRKKEEMNTVLEKLQSFEEERNEIAAQIRKLKRSWEGADSEARKEIKLKMTELAKKFSELEASKDEAEEELYKLEQGYKNSSASSKKET